MKYFISLLLSLFVIMTPKLALADTGGVDRDHPGPWPWGAEIAFPWRGIQGVWRIEEKSGMEMYFSFQVVKELRSGENTIIVKQLANDRHTVLAKGIGYEQDRVVRAVLVYDGLSYNITIRAFKSDKRNDKVMVMTVSTVHSIEEEDTQTFIMEKLSATPIQMEKTNRKNQDVMR